MANITGGSHPSYYQYDALGSALQLSSSALVVTDNYTYKAFGEQLAFIGNTVNPFRFVGQFGYYYDPDPSNYYVRMRIYNPVKGRWQNVDPLWFVATVNWYRGFGYEPGDPGNSTSGNWPSLPVNPFTLAGDDVNLYRYVSNGPTLSIDPAASQPPKSDKEIAISEAKKVIKGPPPRLPQGIQAPPRPGRRPSTIVGPCADFAKAFQDDLKNNTQLKSKLTFYRLKPGVTEFNFTGPGGKQDKATLDPPSNSHIIVEVTVMSNGTPQTLYFDAGSGHTFTTFNTRSGNFGDPQTGLIDPANYSLFDQNNKDNAVFEQW